MASVVERRGATQLPLMIRLASFHRKALRSNLQLKILHQRRIVTTIITSAISLTRAQVHTVLAPCLAGDFAFLVRQHCTPDFVYGLVPGDITDKLSLAGASQKHEFSSVLRGHDIAIKIILEGL